MLSNITPAIAVFSTDELGAGDNSPTAVCSGCIDFDTATSRALSQNIAKRAITSSASAPTITAHSSGSFAIGWQGPDGSGNGIFSRRFLQRC